MLTFVVREFGKCLAAGRVGVGKVDVGVKPVDTTGCLLCLSLGEVLRVPCSWRRVLWACSLSAVAKGYNPRQVDLPPDGMPFSWRVKDLETECAPINAASSLGLIPFSCHSLIRES